MQEDQMTALMFAVKVGSLDVIKLLVEKSSNLFAMNSVRVDTFVHGTHSHQLYCKIHITVEE